MASLPGFRLRDEQTATTFEQMYGADRGMAAAAKETFEAMRLLRSVGARAGASGVVYPQGRFGRALSSGERRGRTAGAVLTTDTRM